MSDTVNLTTPTMFDRDGWPHCADHPARNYDAPWAAKGMQVPA